MILVQNVATSTGRNRMILSIWSKLPVPLVWILIATPVVVAAIYVNYVSVNVPYYDTWTQVPLIEKWHNGSGQWRDLFHPYAARGMSYVVAFGTAVTLLNAQFFHWDLRLEIAVGFALLIATTLILVRYVQSIRPLSSIDSSYTVLLPIMLLMFSLRQYENLIASQSVTFFGASFFVVASMFLITQSHKQLWLASAIVCGVLASLTFSNGLSVWPLALAALIIQRRWRDSLIWLTASMLFMMIYLVFLYEFKAYDRSQVDVGLVLQRFLSMVGGTLCMDKSVVTAGSSGPVGFPDTEMSIINGVTLLSITGFVFWKLRQQLQSYLFPVLVLCYVSASPEPSLTIEVKREARLRLILAPSDQQHSTAGDQRPG